MSWVSDMTIQGRAGALEALGPVSSFMHQKPWEKIEGFPLPGTLEECAARDTYPLPPILDREGYHGERHYDFWISGLKDYALIKAAMERYDAPLKPGQSVLDWGCASGRVLRHFLCQSPGLDLWGADINRRNIEWARRFMGPSLKVFQSTGFPSLPLEDRAFALVYAFSVFTHVGDLEIAWLLELRRVLKPGGIAYLTIVSDDTWKNMKTTWPVHDAIVGRKIVETGETVTKDSFQRPMPVERVTLITNALQTYNCIMFHSVEYIRSVWGRYFEVLDVVIQGSNFQDAVILRKR